MRIRKAYGGLALAILASTPLRAGIEVKGSDTVLPLAQAFAEAYNRKNPKADVSVSGGGSTLGITALINGNTDIATASRPLYPKEYQQAKARGFVPTLNRIAKDGITVVVHPSNPVKSLTMSQIGAIYSGQVSNWKQVGGPDRRITVIGRDSSSCTYGFFRDTLFPGRPYRSDMLTMPSTNAISLAVSRDEGAIGYIGLAFYERWAGKVKEVAVARDARSAPILSTPETVADGSYPLFRYLYLVTRGKPSGQAADFIKFAQSAEGQAVVEKVGYVSLR
jgi:phosphate transport system substrate-binding protein